MSLATEWSDFAARSQGVDDALWGRPAKQFRSSLWGEAYKEAYKLMLDILAAGELPASGFTEVQWRQRALLAKSLETRGYIKSAAALLDAMGYGVV